MDPVVTLLRLHQNRIEEIQEISKDRFRKLNKNQRIAVITTNIRNHTGKVKLIVLEEKDEDQKVVDSRIPNIYCKMSF